MLVLGIMSGTSIDGVDYALCEVTRRTVKLRKLWSRNFPQALRSRLHAAAANQCSAHELSQLHHDLGRLYAKQASQLHSGAELVGLHGQTVFHNPSRRAPATLQIGEPAYLAEVMRVPVVSNFRAADIAAGGQGAPLAPLFHRIAFARRGKHICVNNLGGISNVTSIDWRDRDGVEPKLVAFDTGPANVLMDLAMRKFSNGRTQCDRDGELARRGKPNEPLLKKWLKHPFLRLPPPKSTGREMFGESFWRTYARELGRMTAADTLRTCAEFTARSIASSYGRHLATPPDCLIVCGGGASNGFLLERLHAALGVEGLNPRLERSSEYNWPTEAIEPAAFALLAFYRHHKIAGAFHGTTGVLVRPILGTVSLPPH